MKKLPEHEQFPSGKQILRDYAPDGSLEKESHSYGMLDIGIQTDFRAGTKVEELYFIKRRMVSRRSYEKARTAYPDMPPADTAIEDGGAELLRGIAKKRKQRSLEAQQHKPDPDAAAESDAFCVERMEEGKCADAVSWIKTKNHTLGERDWSGSKARLVQGLVRLGCVRIHACEIDVYEDGMENTGHLVVELPKAAAARAKILKAIDRLASETGYDGPMDDGQRYVYVKLD